jgi:hypothetical protein
MPIEGCEPGPAVHNSVVIKLQLLLGVIAFAVWVFALVDVLGTPDGAQRGGLSKLAWALIVGIFGVIGALAWFVLGRPERQGPRGLSRYERAAPAFPEYDRPGRSAAVDPVKDEEFLRKVRERAEEQRRRHREQQRSDQPEPPTEPEPTEP